MKRAMIFVRGNDTEKQRELCEAYARKLGCTIKGTVEKLSQAYDRSTEIDVLITAGVTRISRNQKNFLEIVEMFDEAGVTILIAD